MEADMKTAFFLTLLVSLLPAVEALARAGLTP